MVSLFDTQMKQEEITNVHNFQKLLKIDVVRLRFLYIVVRLRLTWGFGILRIKRMFRIFNGLSAIFY